MRTMNRRSAVQALLSVPVVNRAILAFSSLPQAEVDRRHLALRALRFVNTAELWHKLEFGSYVDKGALMESPAVERLRNDEVAERAGIGGSLLSEVSPTAPDGFSGWELRLWPRGDNAWQAGGGYVALVRDRSGDARYALATNESGRIYEGAANSAGFLHKGPRSVEDLLQQPMPLGRGTPGGIRGVLGGIVRRAGFLTVAPAIVINCLTACNDCEVCCANAYPSCSPVGAGGCTNCGCAACVWVCCGIIK